MLEPRQKYTVLRPIHHGDVHGEKRYERGETIELTDEHAAPLLKLGTIDNAGAAAGAARTAENVGDLDRQIRELSVRRDALKAKQTDPQSPLVETPDGGLRLRRHDLKPTSEV